MVLLISSLVNFFREEYILALLLLVLFFNISASIIFFDSLQYIAPLYNYMPETWTGIRDVLAIATALGYIDNINTIETICKFYERLQSYQFLFEVDVDLSLLKEIEEKHIVEDLQGTSPIYRLLYYYFCFNRYGLNFHILNRGILTRRKVYKKTKSKTLVEADKKPSKIFA